MTSLKPFEQVPFAAVPERPRLPHAYEQAEVRTVSLDSAPFGPLDVHVRVFGQGPPLALVHGFMTTSYSWRYALRPLGEHFTLYAFDLPGAGRSSKPDASYLPDALADAIGEILGALDLRGAPVIGNSLGGYLCMRLALRDPDAMGRLVNVHSPGLPTARMRLLSTALKLTPGARALIRRLVWRNPEAWVHKNVHYWDESLKSREEHREYAEPLRSPEGVRAFYRMLSETFSVREMKRFERALRALDGAFPIPLRLVYAERDPMVPPIIGRRLEALLPSAEMVWLSEASHFAHVDATDKFVGAVLPFLQRPSEPGDAAS